MQRVNMQRQILCFLTILFLILLSVVGYGETKLPDGLKKYYQYNSQDKSIIPVKERLAELGYFPEDKTGNAWINQTLRDAVKQFQEKNNLKTDGKLNTDLFTALFSDTAIAKSGKVKKITESRSDNNTEDQSINTVVNGKELTKTRTKPEKNSNSNSGMILVVVFALIGITVFSIINAKIRKQKAAEKQFVMEHSKIYAAYKNIEAKYVFFDLPASVSLVQDYKSKQALNNADFIDVFIYLVNDDNSMKEIYLKLKHNRKKYEAYTSENEKLQRISHDYLDSIDCDKGKFIRIEKEICTPRDKPQTDIDINIELRYISKQGNRAYHKNGTVHYDDLEYAFAEAQRKQAMKVQAKIERSKMSAKLRYQVLQRDGARCQICGATEKDGVKLHVDHIIPVSKGGKTELNNLQTLCDRCNLGKGADYDE